MKRRGRSHRSTVSARTRHTTVGAPPPPRAHIPRPAVARLPRRRIAHIIDDEESTLLDVLDNLLDKGVVLNAELILALANVDLVYVRLSAILCAADRVSPRSRR